MGFEGGNIFLGRAVHLVPVDLEVVVDHDVSHAHNRAPRDGGVGVRQRLGQSGDGLADDLDIPDDVGSNELTGVEFGARRRSRGDDLTDGVENVAEEQPIGSQSGTASRMR